MVRKYVRKTVLPSYSKEQLLDAVSTVKNGEMSLYRASHVYKIPKATLFKHVKGQRGLKSSTMGRPTAIPHEEEKIIADCLKTMERWGFGLSKKEVLETIGRYVTENNISTPFKDGVPGDDYFIRFKKTHNLSIKKPQSVEVARKKSIDPFVVSDYFDLLKEVIRNVPPSQIYNMDESSFCLDPKKTKVVGEKGCAAHRATSGSGRENISVLMGANAAGEKLPPLVVFKGKNVWDSWLPSQVEFPNMTYAATTNGWMDTITFERFFKNSFLRHLPSQRPVVVIYDGHNSHVGISLVEEARKQGVTILKLPPHTTHVLQPMDLSVFKPLKDKWDEELVKWQRKNYGRKLPKSTFASTLAKIWKDLDPRIIKNGFEKAGIFPFNDNVVSKDRYDPTQYHRWCEIKRGINNAESQLALPTPSTSMGLPYPAPSTSVTSLPSRSVTFEELLLEQVKQAPRLSNTRKRVCGGAEVITSEEALIRLEETANKKKGKEGQTLRKKTEEEEESSVEEDEELISPDTAVKNKKRKMKASTMEEDSSEEDDMENLLSGSQSDEFDLQEEVEEMEEESDFVKVVNKNVSDASVGDWVVVKFVTHRVVKMFVGQLTEVESCLEAKFARRIASTSSFRWPNVDDKSVIHGDEIFNFLPPPIINKRGTFSFPMSFATYNIG